jgi:sec-independent protein translocase protein TatB
MHFGDYTFIAILALVLFGPKRLPEIARQAGRLMMEFRRASNEFKMQMEEELRNLEEEDRRKKLQEAAANTGDLAEHHALPAETSYSETPADAESRDAAHASLPYTPPSPDEECIDPVDLLDTPQTQTGDLYQEEWQDIGSETQAEDHGPEISAESPEASSASYLPSDEPSMPITAQSSRIEQPTTPQDPVRPESDPAIHHA